MVLPVVPHVVLYLASTSTPIPPTKPHSARRHSVSKGASVRLEPSKDVRTLRFAKYFQRFLMENSTDLSDNVYIVSLAQTHLL